MISRRFAVLTFSLLGLSLFSNPAALRADDGSKSSADQAEVVKVTKIWDKGNHNAFTDLIRFHDQWYCVFREGQAHVSPDGSLRILTSKDGETWKSAALVSMPKTDLRDAKISITPNDELMLAGAGVTQPPEVKSHQSYVWFSKDGKNWSKPQPIGDKNYWIWRVVWHDGKAYGIGYQTNTKKRDDARIRLYRSEDGRHFETWVADMGASSYPNETAILFLEDGTALCVLRRDGSQENSGLLGTSSAPYREWKWEDLGTRIGGPQAIQLPKGQILVAGRRYPGGAKTELWKLDRSKPSLKELLTLPSGGDTSYPGMVYYKGELWMSYYSSHEGKTSIYLAKIRLPEGF